MPVLPGHSQIASSNVHSAGFDPTTGAPEVHFRSRSNPNGDLYRYPNLPPEELRRAIREEPSVGGWVQRVVRTNPEWMKGSVKVSVPQNAPLLEGTPYGEVPKAETVGAPAPPSGAHQIEGTHAYKVGDVVRVENVDHPVTIKKIFENGDIEW